MRSARRGRVDFLERQNNWRVRTILRWNWPWSTVARAWLFRSRQHFSKIQCNWDYNPKKKTVLAFAVGLHLSEDETIDLLQSAGYAFSDGSKRDWIVRYCLEHKIYNINQVNTLLFEYDQEQLGA